MKTPLLSICIVSYNTQHLTIQTLDSLFTDLEQSNLLSETELCIVDNNSSDDSPALLIQWHRTHAKKLAIQLFTNTENTGFASANNQAIMATTGQFVFLLNSDTIVQQGAIQQLLSTFTSHPIDESTAMLSSQRGKIDRLGMVAAQLRNPDGTPQAQGGDLPTLFTLFNQLFFLDDIPFIGAFLPSTQHTGRRAKPPRFTVSQKGWVAATALMIRRSLIEEIGMLDQGIFMYGEDMEWCIRARNKHWDIAIDHQAHIIHFGSASGSSARALIGELEAYSYIWAKHKPHWQRPILKGMLKLSCMLRMVLFGTIMQDTVRAQAYREAYKQIV